MIYSIAATKRTNLGRQATIERDALRVPAVVYGHGIDPRSISVVRGEFVKTWHGAGFSSLLDLTIEKDAPVKVLIKEVQVDPLLMIPAHIDFYQVRMDEELTAKIPLRFVGESPAVKADGGTLIKSLNEIEVRCLPGDLPSEIDIDLSLLKTFEDFISVGSLKLPKGVTAMTEATGTIATVARPLTEDELKKMEESTVGDVAVVKTEAEVKKAAEDAKKAAEGTADDKDKPKEKAKEKK